jgi:hypothetical protein
VLVVLGEVMVEKEEGGVVEEAVVINGSHVNR